MAIRVVHYLNQFFGQIGGEEKADITPFYKDGPVGPGTALVNALDKDMSIVGTVICGDTYFNENIDIATEEIVKLVAGFNPDLLIAGPAFNAGRYGMACGAVCAAVQKKLQIPVITGMYEENPGADMYKKDVYIVKTGNSAAQMRTAIPALGRLASRMAKGEVIGSPAEEGYLSRGIRKNVFHDQRGSARAVEMLLKKMKGDSFDTEYPMPVFDRVSPRPAIKNLSQAKIALVTSGGIVPKGNPDRIESSSASKFGRYDINGVNDLTADTFETAHGGYDPVYANQDADRVLPIDVMRRLEQEGIIGKMHNIYYATVGNGTSVANAKKYAHAIGEELRQAQVDGIILTSTWGTCTRCGATMVKELEEVVDVPVVHVCTVVPISLTVGANRIDPAVAIPYPLGNPQLNQEEEFALRRSIVEKALQALTTDISEQTVF